MALINCTECNHLMSEDASVCPNCNKPRNAEKTKQCINCGKEIGSRRRKCPECETIQTNNNTTKPITMSNNKPNSQSNNFFIYLLIFVIGAALMYVGYPYLQSDAAPIVYDKEIAKVNRIDGIYVYVESYPQDKSAYQVIGTAEGDNIVDMVGSLGIGKEKVGTVLENILNMGKDNINFHEQLKVMVEKVKEQYPDAEGIIFTNKIKKCEVITFN
jgi:RNA polymerase subunit RPABC4/transcription elongation factor Spt4